MYKLSCILLFLTSTFVGYSQSVLDIVVNSEDHNTLETAVLAAGLDGALSGEGPFTVFAPTDAAFAAVPAEVLNSLLDDPMGALTNVLLFHVVSGVAGSGNVMDGTTIGSLQGQNLMFGIGGDGVTINGAMVSVIDIRASNGIVHVIDAVLVPEAMQTRVGGTVLDVVVNSEDHNTLETAVLAAGLQDALAGEGPFTVFAPTDAAFAAVPADVLNSLLDDPTGALASVLLYHVTTGVASTDNISDGLKIGTLQGSNLEFSLGSDGAFVNNAMISVLDIYTDNGVVHVIDAVLVP